MIAIRRSDERTSHSPCKQSNGLARAEISCKSLPCRFLALLGLRPDNCRGNVDCAPQGVVEHPNDGSSYDSGVSNAIDFHNCR